MWDLTHKCVDELNGEPLPGTVRKGALVRREPVTPETGCHHVARIAALNSTRDSGSGS